MPRVPTYDTRVREQPLPQADLPRPPIPEAFGYAAGRGLQNLAADVNDVQLRARRSADLDRLIDLERQLGEIEHGMEHGDAGWRKRRGADARGIGVQYGDEFRKAAEGLGQDLQSPEVKRAWERLRASREFAVRSQVETWEGQETEQASRDGLKALIDVNNARASTAPDLKKMEATSTDNYRALTAYGLEHGWLPEKYQSEKAAADGDMATRALLAWPAEDPTGKRAFLTRWGDALDPRDKAAAIKGVAKVEREAGVLADARSAWEKSGQDYGDATKLADEITAGKPAEWVNDVQALVEDFRLRKVRARDETDRDVLDRASDEFSEAGYRYAGLSAASIEALPPDSIAGFRDLERRIHKPDVLDWSDATDATKQRLADYLLMPVQDRIGVNVLTEFGGRIPWTETLELIQGQQRAKAALADDAQAAARAVEFLSVEDYLKLRAREAGILKKNGKPSGDPQRWIDLSTSAQREISAAQAGIAPGQRLPREAMEKIVDGLLVQGIATGPELNIFGNPGSRRARAFELPGGLAEGQVFEPDEAGAVPYFPGAGADDLSDIPPATLDEILAIDPDLPSSEIRRVYSEMLAARKGK